MKIRIAGNTEAPGYFIIKSKGFNLETIYHEEEEYTDFIARKEDIEISATSMEELSGLITMWEHRGNNWMTSDEEYRLYSNMKYGDKIID